jgi:hypothetical protein
MAELALEHGGRPGRVAFDDRRIEPMQRAQPRGVLCGQARIARDRERDRIARHQPDQQEGDEG